MKIPRFIKTISSLTIWQKNKNGKWDPLLRCGYCNKFMSWTKYLNATLLLNNKFVSHCYHCKKSV